MATSRYWTLAGLSFLLLAMTELTALASSFRLREEENHSDSASSYSQALENDIGSTLQLIDFLLARTDDASQGSDKQPSSRAMKDKGISKTGSGPDLIDSFSDLSQEQNRQNIVAALLQRLQLNTVLDSVGDRKGQAADIMARDGPHGRESTGFENLFKRLPVPSAAAESTKIDDAIPAAIKSKRGRHGAYGAMPPTNELCRMLNMRCY